ncbi:MAG: PEP-CTERM sorting domain-containing protein [Planctomycetota bacterium]|nr:MAG: PEP-CTERM sorting domain-containing protein [Planctomycetota bacterium]
MRALKLGGIPPCGRTFGRTLVAVAAMAALFSATSVARAGVLPFTIDETQSFLTYQTVIDLTAGMGGIQSTTPAFPGSDTTSLYGEMYIDVQPASIAFAPGSQISTAVNASPGVGGIPGNYRPFDPVVSDPVGPPPQGTTPNSNFGLVAPGIGLTAVIYNLVNTLVPGAPMPLVGNNFDLAGQQGAAVDGRQAFVSFLGNDTDSIVGSPIFFGSAAPDIGTWDGTTLTIPIHSTFTTLITDDPFDIFTSFNLTGQIVATVRTVPEPSTMVLAGFGVVGLLSCAYRARLKKRSA